MTVGAQKTQIAFIGVPISEAPRPTPLAFIGPDLGRWVDVVNIEGAEIGESTGRTLSAKFFNQIKLTLPVAIQFVLAVAITVPVGALASIGAESVFTWVAAFFAVPSLPPPCGEVAVLAAVFPIALSDQIWRHFFRSAAVLACNFHVRSIHEWRDETYFDIACRRIEDAYRQADMFVEN